MTFSPSVTSALIDAGLDPATMEEIIARTLAEDLDGFDPAHPAEALARDITSHAVVPSEQHITAQLVARASGVICGVPITAAVFDMASGGEAIVQAHVLDSTIIARDDVLATIAGPAHAVLAAERSALNLACRLSGVATHAFLWASELSGTKTQVLDTRKTTPGLRVLEKYAVFTGGGGNKRMGLWDVAMVKDNHIAAAGSVTAAVKAVQDATDKPVQVEVESLEQAREALDAECAYLLADNCELAQLREIVLLAEGRAEVEATGGLTLSNAKEYAETGVQYLSVGALTHSSPIVDLALDF